MPDPRPHAEHEQPPDWRAEVRARLTPSRLSAEDEADVTEEVAQHLEAQYAELAPRLGGRAARDQLRRQLHDSWFDEALSARRRTTRARHAPPWATGSLVRDIRQGVRALRRSPGTTATGVTALALGIALTTVMFSIVYGMLIRGLPFDDASQIAIIYRADPTGRGEEDLVPFGDFVRYRAAQRSFTAFGAYAEATVSVSGGDRPEHVRAARVTAGVLDVPGVAPMLGRLFTAADNAPGAEPTAIIGAATWRNRFASDSGVIGSRLRVNGRTYAIIGVMPDGYQYPHMQDLWLALRRDPAAFRPGEGTPLTIVGRLRAGTSYENANAELAGLSRRLAQEGGDSTAVRDLAQPFVRAMVPARVYSLLYAMLAAVFLVLLVACANVANLLLDRAVNRMREIGIRLALGASRFAVMRQSLVESTVLALAAAVVGAALAQGGIVAFNRAIVSVGEAPPFWTDVRLHLPVLGFVLATALVASLASGLLPAIHAARLDVSAILKDESQAASSLRVGRASRLIVVAEIALSSMMLLVAGFMTKSIVRLREFDPRFASADILTSRISLTSADTVVQRHLFETLERELAGVSGVQGVYLGTGLPGTGWNGSPLTIEGRVYEHPQNHPIVRSLAVSPGFFQTFDVSTLRGRPILPTDRAGVPPVAVVSEAFARRHFPDVDAIGRRIRLGRSSSDSTWYTIVGVMPSLYAASPTSMAGDHFPPEVLTAFWQQRRWQSAAVAVRGPGAVANIGTVRRIVAGLDREVPVYETASMSHVLAQPAWPLRVFGTMFVIFGVVALALAAIGLYAVMAFSASRRVREMGIRMALGATRGDVVRLICRQGVVQTLLGMGLGLFAGAAVVRLVRAALFEVRPGDASVFVTVAGVLGLAALVACLVPAMGATRVDPVIALRAE